MFTNRLVEDAFEAYDKVVLERMPSNWSMSSYETRWRKEHNMKLQGARNDLEIAIKASVLRRFA
jgi:hypothetical protein